MTRRLRRERWGCRHPMGNPRPPSGPRRLPKGKRKALWRARRRRTDAPTAARKQGLQPYGALTLFFRWRKKSVQKKASGTATPGKRLLLPILPAGLAMSRAMELAGLPIRAERARARLFPPSKWAGLFPSAAYRRSAPPQLARGMISPCRVGCFGVACVFLQGQRPAGNQIHAGLYCKPEGLSPNGGKSATKLLSTERSARIARSPGSRGTAPCASREACRRAALAPQPTRFPSCSPAPAGRGVGCRGTAPAREACRRAAVTPQPSCFPSSSPAPKGRGVGCRGTAPASRVRRRRGIGR